MTQSYNNYNSSSGNLNYLKGPSAILAAATFLLGNSAFAGSSGIGHDKDTLVRKNSTSLSIIVESTVNRSNIDSLSRNHNSVFPNQLDLIKNTFGLYDEELAQLCHVTRKTVSNWKNSTSMPRDKSRERVFELYTLAKDWKEQNFPGERELMTTSLVGGESVLELLQAEELNKQNILFAGRRLFRQSLKNTDTVLL